MMDEYTNLSTKSISSFKPWEILHLDLSKGIPELSSMSGVQGIYIIFWWHEIPLGNRKILNTDFPLSASQVTQLALKSITQVVRNYLMEEGFEALLQEIQRFYSMRGHVSALLIQFERYKDWGNLRRLLITLPRHYIILIKWNFQRYEGKTQNGSVGNCRMFVWSEVLPASSTIE